MRTIPLYKPFWGIKEILQVAKIIYSGKGGGGEKIGRLVEKEIKTLLNVKHCFLCNSGTGALELSLLSLNLPSEFEAIVPSFTFVSTANAVVREGGHPVFVDIEEETFNINPDLIEEKITEKTKVIIPVHYGGVGCRMEKIMEIAKKYSLFVIEDAAHAFGAKYKSNWLGTFGNTGCFSFHITKNLVCGEGGAIVTNEEDLAGNIEIIREKGTDSSKFLRGEIKEYRWINNGSNFLLSDILAGILYQQLKRINKINLLRRKKAIYLWKRLKMELGEKIILPSIEKTKEPNWHIFAIRVKDKKLRDAVIEYLNNHKIKASFHYLPLHLSPYIQKKYKYKKGDLPVTEKICDTLIRLPLYPQISYFSLNYIVKTLKEAIIKNKNI